MQRHISRTVVWATIAAIVGLGAASHSAHGALEAYWPFDETGGTTAPEVSGSSGGPYTGTVLGVGSWSWTAGQLGNALSFDGNDHVTTLNTEGLNNPTVSVSVWAYPTGTNQYTEIVCKNDGHGDGSWALMGPRSQFNPSAPPFRYYVYPGGSSAYAEYPDPDLNQWYHLVGSYDGTDVKLYVNGAAPITTSAPGGTAASTVPILIGKESNPNTQTFFKGTIDDVAVWHDGLTDGEAKALYTLATESSLQYDAGKADRLFTLHDAEGGVTSIDGRPWQYTTGLGSELELGVVTQIGEFYYLKLDPSGTGVTTLPEPSSLLIFGLGFLGLLGYLGWRRPTA